MRRTLLGFLAGALVASCAGWLLLRVGHEPRQAEAFVQTAAQPVSPLEPAPAALQPAGPVKKPAPFVKQPAKRTPSSPASAPSTTEPPAPAPPEQAASAPLPIPPAAPEPEVKPAERSSPELVKQEKSQPAPPRTPRSISLPEGTLIMVRVNEALTSEKNQAGDTFNASLDQPLIVEGLVIAERGARAQGRVIEASRSGKVKGLASLKVGLAEISTSDGQKVKLTTTPFEKTAESSTKSDAVKVGVGAAIGAAIGAIAGGGRGAAIGAGAGGAAGAGSVLLTRGKPAEIPAETRLTFRLAQAVSITENLR